jgi:hypothetical protein
MTSIETPRLLSEYFAARAQSAGLISANADIDVAAKSQTIGWHALHTVETTSHLYSP